MPAVQNLSHCLSHWNRCLTSLILSVCLLSICLGCQKKPPIDAGTEKTAAQGEEQSTSTPEEKAAKEKPGDPKMAIKAGEPMTAERYQAVKEHLKQIGLALHFSHDEHRHFLPTPKAHPEFYDKNGQLKVSWRVHILPFLDQQLLYDQFKLDETWDSPHNAPLAKKMPEVYHSPDTPAGSDKTRFRVFEGQWKDKTPTTLFPAGTPIRIRDIVDGTSNTVMVVEVGPDQAVEWTRPGGLDAAHPKEAFGSSARGIPAILADGAPLCIKRDIDDADWKAMIGPADGTIIDWNAFRISHSTLKPKQAQTLQQLRQIVLAFHNYADKYSRFPPADEHLTDGKPTLSWRVHLLPFMGQDALYQQFHLDEPWDSPHNKTLLSQMPAIYQFGPPGKPGETRVMTFSGEKTPFPGGPGARIRDILDGTSNTILFVITAPDKTVPWTKPEDLPFDPANPIKALGTLTTPDFPAALIDGSIRSIPASLPAQTLANLIQPADGNVINVDLPTYKPPQ